MSGWYYRKKSLLDESTEGPISDAEFLQLAYDGKLKLDTLVTSQQHTKAQWATVGQIPAARKKLEEGADVRRQAKEHAAAEAAQNKEEKRVKAAELKQTLMSDHDSRLNRPDLCNSLVHLACLDGGIGLVWELGFRRGGAGNSFASVLPLLRVPLSKEQGQQKVRNRLRCRRPHRRILAGKCHPVVALTASHLVQCVPGLEFGICILLVRLL